MADFNAFYRRFLDFGASGTISFETDSGNHLLEYEESLVPTIDPTDSAYATGK